MAKRIRAYSYLRFSTPEQARGDSFRRQSQAAKGYASKHGLDLQDVSYHDLGVSAYRGSNVTEGKLGQFLAAVDDGSVPRGSYLLVENLDRLSRDRIMPALQRFAALLEKGITVVTLSDGREYTSDSLNDLTGLIVALAGMARAHEESSRKAHLLSAAWQNKRAKAAENGKVLTAMAPAWLRLRPDRTFEVRKDRAKVVQRIFKMALEGHGKASIARRLNEEGIAPFGDGASAAHSKADGWHPSYIRKILSNPAVIGRFQPMRRVRSGEKAREPDGPAIDAYFPAVVAETDFYRVQRAAKGASGRTIKGRHYPLSNILSGLVRCERCGGMLHAINKGKRRKTGTSDRYFACDNARRKQTCDAPSVRYRLVMTAILNTLEDGEIDLRSLMDVGGSKDRRPQLREKLEGIEGQIDETEKSIANLLGALERRPSPLIEKRLEANEVALAKLKEDRAQAEDDLRQAVNGNGDHVAELREAAREFNRVMRSKDAEAIGEKNIRLNAALKRIIGKIEIGVSDAARDWMDKGMRWADRHTKGNALPAPALRKLYADIVKDAKVSIGVAFKAPGRLIVIAADRRKTGRYVAGAAWLTKGDRIEEFALKVSS